jgi:drug/metabolite transporter (DMT)-like permease
VRPRDIAELLLLAAIWGASFVFMRVSVPSFGPLPLALVRVAGAVALLLPLVAINGQLGALRAHWKPIAVVGLANSALPFVMYGVASLVLTGGVMSIINATTPMWGAIMVRLIVGERMTRLRIVGLAIGFAGVAWLAWHSVGTKEGAHGVSPAVAVGACLVATFGYGLAAALSRKWLTGVPSMASAAGSQCAAAVALALPAALMWPQATPSAGAWSSALALALLCTGVAYLLYFRLIASAGATNATTVTFLIPAFAVLWGSVLLDEPLTPSMVAACALILLGTALTTGLWTRRGRKA